MRPLHPDLHPSGGQFARFGRARSAFVIGIAQIAEQGAQMELAGASLCSARMPPTPHCGYI
jgi:hypothetical protein